MQTTEDRALAFALASTIATPDATPHFIIDRAWALTEQFEERAEQERGSDED